jgi:DNA-binding response OmpR family regulator
MDVEREKPTCMKILVIEDEPELREVIVSSLKEESYVVETAESFDMALGKIGVYDYDCILLDIGLPGGSGLDLLKELKKEGKETGVIIVSAKGSIDDKVWGLDLGADDYLPKPFHMAELHARIKSIIRRKTLNGNVVVELNNISINTAQRTVMVDEKEIPLNRKEYDVLLYLVTNKNRLVNKTALAEHVWGDYIDEVSSFDFVYSQIKNLRKKLKDAKADVEINAVYGLGYKLTEG